MKTLRRNRLRDHSRNWFIIDSLMADSSTKSMTKHQQRELVKQRLAQECRVPNTELATNSGLKSTVSRIMALLNPVNARAVAEVAEARKRGVHFHKCYSIAIGRLSLAEALQLLPSPSNASGALNKTIHEAKYRGYKLGIRSCLYLQRLETALDFDAAKALLRELANGETMLLDPECLRDVDGAFPDTVTNRKAFAKWAAQDQEDAQDVLREWSRHCS